MYFKLALSARDVLKAKIWQVSVAPVPRVLPLCAKSLKVFKKKHVKPGLGMVMSGLSLDKVWTSLRRLRARGQLNVKARRAWPGLCGFAY